MFLNKKTLLTAAALLAVTGCVTTDNPEQTTQITNLESSLMDSKTLAEKTQAELDSANATLKVSEDKITELTIALEKSKNAVKTDKPVKETTPTTKSKEVTHVDDKSILGQSEWVYVSSVKENFKGRIDTGAATSSINAIDIERFERDGKKWVRFNLSHAKDQKPQVVEARIVRIATITQSSKPGEETERPVVKMHVRIGDVAHQTEFTLTNRMHMEYPVLIGRTFMQDVALVDVSKEYIFPKYQEPTKK